MPRPHSCVVLIVALLGTLSRAQTGAHSADAAMSGDPVQLSPFEIIGQDDRSYQTANTLGATRTNVPIRDLPMQINVVTEQFMADFALFDLNEVVDMIPGTARAFDEFLPQVNIRGFDSMQAMRNGVRGTTVPDMTSIARVEVVKGPAALVYGWAQPGGVVNYITKNPSPTRKAIVRISAGSNQLLRSELDAAGPINDARTFSYRLGITRHRVEHGERQRSLDRVILAPMLQWRPFPQTSIIVRYSYTHDDIRPGGGLMLKPMGASNRGGDPSYFYPFNGLDAPRNPQWVTSVGPNFLKDSPSSYRDLKPVIWELEATHRLNRAMDVRVNLAYHRRAVSGIRESDTALVNPWTTAPVIAQLGGYNGWHLDHTRGDPFPEAKFSYALARSGESPFITDPLADTRLLNGRPYVYEPAIHTLQYVDGVTGWRRVTWAGNNRRERRVNGVVEVVTRLRTGALHHTLLAGFERNDEHRWENNSMLLRDPSLRSTDDFRIPNTATRVPNTVNYYYNIFDAASTAGRDAFARRNLPPLSRFTSSGEATDRRHAANAINANWSVSFLANRGRLVLGGRYDDISARVATKHVKTNPIGFDGPITTWTAGTISRATPQAGLSLRVAEPVTVYALYSQSVYPLVSFQPARDPALVARLLERYEQDGLPAPNLDALPWGQFFDPQYGESLEYGMKTELFRSKLMLNLSYFIIDKKNIARPKPDADPDSAATFNDFTGTEKATGVDVDFYARPLPGLQIGGGGLYNQTEIVAADPGAIPSLLATNFNDAAPRTTFSRIGLREPNAPKWSGNAYLRYEFQNGAAKGIGLGISFNYMGARREENILRWSEAWSRWDVNASYRRKLLERPTSFSLVVRNVTDRVYRVDRDTFAQNRQFVASVALEL